MALSMNDVNSKGSFTWIRCNDDARSGYFRNLFCQKFGGYFTRVGRYYEWSLSENEIQLPEDSQPVINTEPKKTWVFKDPDGNIVKTTNIQHFCKEYELTRSSLYEVISGQRNTHKGYSFIETVIE